jgi:hypothetical protein
LQWDAWGKRYTGGAIKTKSFELSTLWLTVRMERELSFGRVAMVAWKKGTPVVPLKKTSL